VTRKEFLNAVANGKSDILQTLLDTIQELSIQYCVIGGLAVNAYVEPVVSLDLDIVVAADSVERLCNGLLGSFRIERFPHSVNLSSSESDLRIQLQTDPRYQAFVGNASLREVMGYRMRVAALEDVLRGKVWAYSDRERRGSKRQKDLADILRIVEAFPELTKHLPDVVREAMEM
jgi:hypothetical protein